VERWKEVASRQWGVVARPQLRAVGLSEDQIWRLILSGHLVEILPAVYRAAGTAENWHQALMAACLWGGDAGVASHRSAGVLWGLDGFREGPIEITTPRNKRFAGRFLAHRSNVPPAYTTQRAGIPVTNAFRTVWDLAGVLDDDRSEQLFDEALRKGLVSMDAMWRMLEREGRQGRKGGRAVRRLLEERDPAYQPPASELQRKVRNLLVAGGITGFVEEYVIVDGQGTFIARGDIGLLEVGVIIEAEGRANHSSKLDWYHDLSRRNKVTAQGYAVVHATWNDIKNRPEEWLRDLKQVIRSGRSRGGR
jgi:hypothetical protein